MTATRLCCDQNRPEVVDVGQRWSGDDRVSQRLEKAVGFVIGEAAAGVDALRLGTRQAVGTNVCPRDLLAAVDAISVAGESVNTRAMVERDSQRKQELHVAAATAMTPDRHRGLTARQ